MLYETRIRDIRAFFAHPKPTLRKALVSRTDNDITEIMDLLSLRTGGLQEFKLFSFLIPLVCFDTFIEKNQRLHSVHINFPCLWEPNETLRGKGFEILKSCLNPPFLKSLYLGQSDQDDDFIPERFRNFLARRGIDFQHGNGNRAFLIPRRI